MRKTYGEELGILVERLSSLTVSDGLLVFTASLDTDHVVLNDIQYVKLGRDLIPVDGKRIPAGTGNAINPTPGQLEEEGEPRLSLWKIMQMFTTLRHWVGNRRDDEDHHMHRRLSNIRHWVASSWTTLQMIEPSVPPGATSGVKPDSDVFSPSISAVSIADIREGGPEQVLNVLDSLPINNPAVIVNAIDQQDVNVFMLALLQAEMAGMNMLYCVTSGTFLGSRLGQEPPQMMTRSDVDKMRLLARTSAQDTAACFSLGSVAGSVDMVAVSVAQAGSLRGHPLSEEESNPFRISQRLNTVHLKKEAGANILQTEGQAQSVNGSMGGAGLIVMDSLGLSMLPEDDSNPMLPPGEATSPHNRVTLSSSSSSNSMHGTTRGTPELASPVQSWHPSGQYNASVYRRHVIETARYIMTGELERVLTIEVDIERILFGQTLKVASFKNSGDGSLHGLLRRVNRQLDFLAASNTLTPNSAEQSIIDRIQQVSADIRAKLVAGDSVILFPVSKFMLSRLADRSSKACRISQSRKGFPLHSASQASIVPLLGEVMARILHGIISGTLDVSNYFLTYGLSSFGHDVIERGLKLDTLKVVGAACKYGSPPTSIYMRGWDLGEKQGRGRDGRDLHPLRGVPVSVLSPDDTLQKIALLHHEGSAEKDKEEPRVSDHITHHNRSKEKRSKGANYFSSRQTLSNGSNKNDDLDHVTLVQDLRKQELANVVTVLRTLGAK